MPGRRNHDAELFKEGGTIVGGVVGGLIGAAEGGVGAPAGAAGGAALGRGIGASAGQILSPDRPTPSVQRGQGVAAPGQSQQPGAMDTAFAAYGAYEGAGSFNAKAGGGQTAAQPSAMQRRMDTQSDAVALAEADAALDQMPPEYKQRYGPSIKQARYLDAQKRGMA